MWVEQRSDAQASGVGVVDFIYSYVRETQRSLTRDRHCREHFLYEHCNKLFQKTKKFLLTTDFKEAPRNVDYESARKGPVIICPRRDHMVFKRTAKGDQL